MTQYYEPMLYMSTKEHPNTMGVEVVLKEDVDGAILTDVVERLRARFPYFYVKAVRSGNDLSVEPNPLPLTVRNTWSPIVFNCEESNFHLAAWKYQGKRMAFEIAHSLTDGIGVLPYIKSVLFSYLSCKTGLSFDKTGFRLVGDKIPESEIGNPVEGFDIDGAEMPLYLKKPSETFFRMNDSGINEPTVTRLRLEEAELMQYCKDYDGSPNAFLCVMMAKAIRRLNPDIEKPITASIAIDHKAMLGNHDNYRQFANVIEVEFPKNNPLDNVLKSCTVVRGQMMLQASKENSLWSIKQRKLTYAKLDQLPLEMKTGVIAQAAGRPRWTFCVSYANSRSFGPLDPYIEELYILAEPGVGDIVMEIACINHHFFLSVGQNFSSSKYVDAFIEELSSIGVHVDVMSREIFQLCGIESFDKN